MIPLLLNYLIKMSQYPSFHYTFSILFVIYLFFSWFSFTSPEIFIMVIEKPFTFFMMKKGIKSNHNNIYIYMLFLSSQCHLVYNWGKVVHLQWKSYRFGPLICDTICNLISHVYVFLITRPLVHCKNKNKSLESRLQEDIWHQTFWSNSYGKI